MQEFNTKTDVINTVTSLMDTETVHIEIDKINNKYVITTNRPDECQSGNTRSKADTVNEQPDFFEQQGQAINDHHLNDDDIENNEEDENALNDASPENSNKGKSKKNMPLTTLMDKVVEITGIVRTT